MLKLDSLQQKPWYFQFAIFGFLALLIYGGFYYFVTSGTREETKTLQAQVDKLQQENARAQIASQRLNDFKATYARAQADYEDLKALLPEQRELTTVLQSLQERARGRLSVTRFTPKDDVQQDFYAGKPVEIEVSSSYNNLGAFFAQIAAYQRIVSISDFKVSRMKDQNAAKTVDAQFLLTAYYASSEKLQNTAKPANPTAPAAATTAPAPAAK
ncbi:MAG TPA: type 4a pilus biogenesis protein PilO [Pyrinomonadaceae bacterium]|jgi:type IV pilus assembly protein PilO|nr:type 4a pilus biogenesis protein PilO [Pyrinomonadaceae bacterium]